MRTNVAYDKLCDTLPIIKRIVDKAKADPTILENLKAAAEAKSKLDYLVSIPPLLKLCKEEVFAMLSIWNDKTVEEIEAQEHMVTVKEIMKIFADGDLMGFFSSAQESAQENTDTEESSTTSGITGENSHTEQTDDVTFNLFANT